MSCIGHRHSTGAPNEILLRRRSCVWLPMLGRCRPSRAHGAAASLPAEIGAASASNRTMTHLAAEFFKMMGREIVHVPSRGPPSALTDLITT